MRLLLFALMVLLVSFSSVARAASAQKISTCPISEFLLRYPSGEESDGLSKDQIATIDASVARARLCNLRAIDVFPNSASGDRQLWQRRVGAVREALIARGIGDELIAISTTPETESPDWAESSVGEGVVVLIRFR